MSEPRQKRAYKTPTLVVHGSIETITLAGYQQDVGVGGNGYGSYAAGGVVTVS